jgi:hypothetical protein
MQSTRTRSGSRTRSLTLRVDRASERRFALALITLMSLATISVLATTSALSRQHAGHLVALNPR